MSTHNRDLAEQQLVTRLPNAVVLQNPVALPFATPLPWPPDTVARLAVVVRLESHHKGLDVLLDALNRALVPFNDWSLELFGLGPDEAALRQHATDLGLGERVHFRGFESNPREIWTTCHLLVLPSRREGCSIAMLEALLCGRPVLATAVGGVSDWIKPGVNGYICPRCDIETLTASLREAWDSRAGWPHSARRPTG
ncbi:MAG: glycosyltransferase [Opitutaceae bacterium]|nr:glycosyltransferase [Opitutaceae bacterium]